MKNFIFILFCSQLISIAAKAQTTDDLLSLVDEKPKKEFTTATFKTTRNINFHTTEVIGKKCLDFRISHRFGDINTMPGGLTEAQTSVWPLSIAMMHVLCLVLAEHLPVKS
jgi:hypothetical protein